LIWRNGHAINAAKMASGHFAKRKTHNPLQITDSTVSPVISRLRHHLLVTTDFPVLVKVLGLPNRCG